MLDRFSLLQKLISVNYLRLEKLSGKFDLTKTEKKKIPSPPPFAWKISVNNLQLLDILLSLNQKSESLGTEVISEFVKLSGNNLDFVSGKLVISKLKLEDPEVLYKSSGKRTSSAKTKEPHDTISSTSPMTIECSALNIKNGSFLMNSEPSDSNNILSKLLPLQQFNTLIKDFVFSPEVKEFDISRISFALNDQNILQSGKIVFRTDNRRSVNLEIQLAATIKNNRLSDLSRNDTIHLSAYISGSMDSLQMKNSEYMHHQERIFSCPEVLLIR